MTYLTEVLKIEGIISSYNKSGYGVIRGNDGKKYVFYSYETEFPIDKKTVGEKVLFEISKNEHNRAKNVRWFTDRKNMFDNDGYSLEGYDRQGYNRDGYNIDGYDKQGYDKNGYNKDGYDKQGFNRYGYDKQGRDRTGHKKSDKNPKLDQFVEKVEDGDGSDTEQIIISKALSELGKHVSQSIDKDIFKKLSKDNGRYLIQRLRENIHGIIKQRPETENRVKDIYRIAYDGKIGNDSYGGFCTYVFLVETLFDQMGNYLSKQNQNNTEVKRAYESLFTDALCTYYVSVK